MKLPFAYLIGEPGIGKTSLVAALLRATGSPVVLLPAPAKATLVPDRRLLLLGHYGGAPFDGTDTLGYTAQPVVMRFLADAPSALGISAVLAEGDRLANAGFFEWARANFDFRLIRLRADPALVAARRAGRGTKQNPTWLKGRATKVENLARDFSAIPLDAGMASPEALASRVSDLLA